ncbi:dihydrolipoyl dehydrogenase [Pseudomaricurvus alkylphenolicus]|uniref:dihydrolipoyl dehydrogenase n=1 Tax=Pseudomaricurvus alkylphenolicus TaxID=1306991 RepID=UPI00141FD1F2|nr:dihydrolipoyl dehydrogenase [Pseudomaricurvus alkylphenolicus]NIB44183.1 dihydrolipoyl dehydrogenase [Pseudomaricurvus alkylphenolicus]
MTEKKTCKVLVVGAGPGGYVAAIRAGQLGLDTIIVEGERTGGTCLIRGCIPSKALIHGANRFQEIQEHVGDGKFGISLTSGPELNMARMIAWKDSVVDKLNSGVEGLLKKAGVTVVKGWATFSNAKNCTVTTADGDIQIEAEHVILANGSSATELPNIPYSEHVVSSTEALQLTDVPKHLVVIGAGYIGLELGIAYRKLGAEVTFVEGLERLLPLYDKEMTRPIEQWLKKHKTDIIYQARAQSVEEIGGKPVLTYTDKNGEQQQLSADKILVTVGRRPNTNGWGLENMCVDMDGPFVKVDNQCRTAMRNVWAIGDLVGEPMLAHKASAQGEMVAEIIAGHRREFDPVAIPAVCFTEPEIVGVGLTPEQAKNEGEDVIVGKFPFAAIGKALAMDAGTDGGFVRITARKADHIILGIHAVGAHVAELSGEFALALEMGARLEDLAHTIHVHPSLSEATMEAALATLGKAIHISNG